MEIDLHIHSDKSDGFYNADQIFELARENRLKYLSVTDHDILNEPYLKQRALEFGLTLIDGIELSSYIPAAEVHILGYSLKRTPALKNKLEELRQARLKRFKAIIQKLDGIGIHIDAEDALKSIKGTAGRSMAARALVAKGFCKNISEAFEKYLSRGRPAYIENQAMTSVEAIKLIKQNGGIACLAHPYRIGLSEMELSVLIKRFKDYGLDAIETIYPTHSPQEISFLRRQCDKNKLIPSIGSDFHGGAYRGAAPASTGGSGLTAKEAERLLNLILI